jgi:hypothetical protein
MNTGMQQMGVPGMNMNGAGMMQSNTNTMNPPQNMMNSGMGMQSQMGMMNNGMGNLRPLIPVPQTNTNINQPPNMNVPVNMGMMNPGMGNMPQNVMRPPMNPGAPGINQNFMNAAAMTGMSMNQNQMQPGDKYSAFRNDNSMLFQIYFNHRYDG